MIHEISPLISYFHRQYLKLLRNHKTINLSLAAKQTAWFSIGRGEPKVKVFVFFTLFIFIAQVYVRPGTDKDRDGLKNNGERIIK